jgi:hypothetical protein
MGDQLRFISYGGGVQSTALLVLAAQQRIDFTTFVMANVGDDSEMPATLRYVRDVAMPFAEANGIDLHLIDRRRRDGSIETLYGRLTKDGSRSLPIPVRMSNGAPGSRSCTADFKIRVTGKWAKQHGATAQRPAVVGIGISADEVHRANNRRVEPHERVVYPLIGVGEDTGLRLNRADCARLIQRADLPVPSKSSCWFCPFHRPQVWDEMARTDPGLFARAADLEDTLNRRRDALGKDHVYLTRFGRPLRAVARADQQTLPLMTPDKDEAALDNCDSGWCMT